ncbi:Kinesin-like protein KIF21B, partial [Tetrabaena socialis]
VRPLITRELFHGSRPCASSEGPCVTIGRERRFTFDHAFGPGTQQAQVYQELVAPLVESCFDGFNVTVLAYGQTGSGKTFTMGTGECSEEHEMGIAPRVIRHVFSGIDARKRQSAFYVRAQFLEIYNEEVKDLLLLPSEQHAKGGSGISLREAADGTLMVIGAREEPAECSQQLEQLLERGMAARATSSTLVNEQSSRSHAILTIIIEQHMLLSASLEAGGSGRSSGGSSGSEDGGEAGSALAEGPSGIAAAGEVRTAKLHLVGLLALGNVISALGDERRRGSHVPYRESKLTRLLQDSLGGNSRTAMIACISCADEVLEETLNTLKYANRARNIRNKPVVNRRLEGELASCSAELREAQDDLERDEVIFGNTMQELQDAEAARSTGAGSHPGSSGRSGSRPRATAGPRRAGPTRPPAAGGAAVSDGGGSHIEDACEEGEGQGGEEGSEAEEREEGQGGEEDEVLYDAELLSYMREADCAGQQQRPASSDETLGEELAAVMQEKAAADAERAVLERAALAQRSSFDNARVALEQQLSTLCTRIGQQQQQQLESAHAAEREARELAARWQERAGELEEAIGAREALVERLHAELEEVEGSAARSAQERASLRQQYEQRIATVVAQVGTLQRQLQQHESGGGSGERRERQRAAERAAATETALAALRAQQADLRKQLAARVARYERDSAACAKELAALRKAAASARGRVEALEQENRAQRLLLRDKQHEVMAARQRLRGSHRAGGAGQARGGSGSSPGRGGFPPPPSPAAQRLSAEQATAHRAWAAELLSAVADAARLEARLEVLRARRGEAVGRRELLLRERSQFGLRSQRRAEQLAGAVAACEAELGELVGRIPSPRYDTPRSSAPPTPRGMVQAAGAQRGGGGGGVEGAGREAAALGGGFGGSRALLSDDWVTLQQRIADVSHAKAALQERLRGGRLLDEREQQVADSQDDQLDDLDTQLSYLGAELSDGEAVLAALRARREQLQQQGGAVRRLEAELAASEAGAAQREAQLHVRLRESVASLSAHLASREVLHDPHDSGPAGGGGGGGAGEPDDEAELEEQVQQQQLMPYAAQQQHHQRPLPYEPYDLDVD